MNSKVMMMAALAICGCASMEQQLAPESEEMVELSFRIPSQQMTKVSGDVADDEVKDLQVFVFGQDGQLHAYGHAESDQLTLTCSTGAKTIAAIVNAPSLSTVADENTLRGRVSLFSDNSLGRFVMAGIEPKNIDQTGEVIIPVSRLVSKVVLTSVTNDFEFLQHREMNFAIKSVFLTNAAKDKPYYKTSNPTAWYNKGVSDMQVIAQSGNMLYETFQPVSITYKKTHQSGKYLYCYPNPKPEELGNTYLVVEAILEGNLCYYPVKLPEMESNKCYNVALTIRRPGSATPDVPVDTESAVFKVDIQSWTYVDVPEII